MSNSPHQKSEKTKYHKQQINKAIFRNLGLKKYEQISDVGEFSPQQVWQTISSLYAIFGRLMCCKREYGSDLIKLRRVKDSVCRGVLGAPKALRCPLPLAFLLRLRVCLPVCLSVSLFLSLSFLVFLSNSIYFPSFSLPLPLSLLSFFHCLSFTLGNFLFPCSPFLLPSTFISLPCSYFSLHPHYSAYTYLSIFLTIHLFVNLNIYLPTCLSVYLSIYLTIHLFCQSIHLPTYLPTYLFVYISICLFIYLFVYLSTDLSIPWGGDKSTFPSIASLLLLKILDFRSCQGEHGVYNHVALMPSLMENARKLGHEISCLGHAGTTWGSRGLVLLRITWR